MARASCITLFGSAVRSCGSVLARSPAASILRRVATTRRMGTAVAWRRSWMKRWPRRPRD
eukprot:scaffold1732_cov223-Pinguiococcus_pyrenoidosus.AAC.1